ncbi:MAG: hypothetical protein EXS35_15940 [Pedosphaera sp.]|nr:hypothetical protein [Pedosphaera sp.]
MNVFFLWSLMDEEDGLVPVLKLSPAAREGLLIFGAIFLIIVVATVWAMLSRKSRSRAARRADRRLRKHSFAKRTAQGLAEIKEYVRERQASRRRRHRPRNPTLAETGGLPPVRTDHPAPGNPGKPHPPS